ncbi:MAG: hypothetical protein P8Z37_10150 [Acidobacteriota bacterium]|jgi:hypothetical protein
MIIEFGIQINDEEGNPLHGAEVTVHYPWGVDNSLTDSNGWVRFEKSQIFGDAAFATIYVDGNIKADGIWIETGAVMVFQSSGWDEKTSAPISDSEKEEGPNKL